MAKRKKSSRKIKKEVPPSVFWPMAGATIMLVAAVFLLLGGFGTGGPLPKSMFNGVYWALGWAAYLAPIALIFFGVHKFASEDKQIPLSKFVSMTGFLAFTAAYLGVAFSAKNEFSGQLYGGHGGEIGKGLGELTLKIIDKVPASFMYFVFAVLAFFWAFGLSLKLILNVFDVFRRSDNAEGDMDLASLKARSGETILKMNEGVPIEHHRISSGLKNAAQKMAPAEDHEALTTAADPDWQFPPLNLLNQKQDKADPGDVGANAQAISDTFGNFNIDVEMEGANIGPRLTQYTLKPPHGVKLTKMTALENNLALDLAAHSIRIEAPIPGKRLVGIEVPNVKSATVTAYNLMTSNQWDDIKGPLGFAIGKDITGAPIVGDLSKMPHLLIAGQTGSGKSVMINTLLTTLLYRNSPAELKLILVDPKLVELSTYNDIPHLITPVITEPEKCISALKWAVAEMERRLRTMSEVKTANIAEYNDLKKEGGMPYIVIVIDELAELMMMAARDVESLIVRLAQKARATGIHLVLATQRPSVDVITGLIKANVPARISFTVVSQIDSRTIIDQMGAEKLLGQGDMLYLTSDMPKPRRAQGAFISKSEVVRVTDFLRGQRPPQYDEEVISQPVQLNGRGGIVADYGANEANDDMWRDAVRVVIEGRKASTSLLQRRLRVGYARAARLVETMEEQGIVGPADGSRPREVLVKSMEDVFGGKSASNEGDVYDDMPDDESDE